MIRLRSVSKVYERSTILRDLDLQVDAGEFVFLTGPSGAGKTTLLRLLYAAERPSDGEVWVAGRRVDELSRNRLPLLRRKIGVIFQDFKLPLNGPGIHCRPQRTQVMVQVGSIDFFRFPVY